MSKPEPRNPEAYAEWVAAHEAAGRRFDRKVEAARQYLVATGRADEDLAALSLDDLAHDKMLATHVQMRAKAGQREDGHYYLNSRLGLHPDVEAREREGGYDHRAEAAVR